MQSQILFYMLSMLICVIFIRTIWGKNNYPHFMDGAGEGNGTPLQYSCLENPMDGGAWWAAVQGVPKSRTRLSDFTFTFHFPALEKEMATHSSVLVWRIPGTGEPGSCHFYSRWSSQPRDQTYVSGVSCIGRQNLYHWAIWEAQWIYVFKFI